MEQLRWGFISTSNIGKKLKKTIDISKNGKVVAVSSRSIDSANKYIKEISLPGENIKGYTSIDDLLDDENIDIVYIPLPSALKKDVCIKAANKKKHLLCEKPFASSEEVKEITDACKSNGVAFLDGTMFVHSPRTALIQNILKQNQSNGSDENFGRVRHVTSEFCWVIPDEEKETNQRANKDLEPLGALGDLGWYNARSILIAFDYELPQKVTAVAVMERDTIFKIQAILQFSGGRTANFFSSFDHGVHQSWKIASQYKTLTVNGFVVPWTSEPIYFPKIEEKDQLEIEIRHSSGELKTQKVELNGIRQEVSMVNELDRLVRSIKNGNPDLINQEKWAYQSFTTQKLLDLIKEAAISQKTVIVS